MKRIALVLMSLALTLGLSVVSFAAPTVSISESPSLQSAGTPTAAPTPAPKKQKKEKKPKKQKKEKKPKKPKKQKKQKATKQKAKKQKKQKKQKK